jgi:phage tail P2-like protein
MTDHLLPPNATPLETAFDGAAGARVEGVDFSPLHHLKDPATCPAHLLPWLAWERSVDTWTATLTEAQRRAVIAAAPAIHRIKGTPAAVRMALDAAGFDARIVEWFQTDPPGDPFTFAVEVAVTDRGADATAQRDAEAVALATKNVRSHPTRLDLVGQVAGPLYLVAATTSGELVEVRPWIAGAIMSAGPLYLAAATYSAETVTVMPEAA